MSVHSCQYRYRAEGGVGEASTAKTNELKGFKIHYLDVSALYTFLISLTVSYSLIKLYGLTKSNFKISERLPMRLQSMISSCKFYNDQFPQKC